MPQHVTTPQATCISGHGNTWSRFRRALRLPPTAEADQWHRQTQQPDPGAMSYAYTQLGLTFTSPIGPTILNRDQFLFAVPYTIQPLQRPVTGVGGLVQGQPLTTQLLISQADAIARGLRASGEPVPAGVVG